MERSDPDAHPRPGMVSRRLACIRRTKQISFGAFVLLVLISPSLTHGPFSWLPMVQVVGITDTPVGVGPLALLPAVVSIAWALERSLRRPAVPWCWGRLGITLPLAGLSLLMLSGLQPALNGRTIFVLVTVALLWWVYFFVLNEVPHLGLWLALVVVIQGSVAIGQFALQEDLGLAALGEPALDPQVSGISVLFARDQRWLRAYGLTGHPNLLGAMLSLLLLLLMGDMVRARGWRQRWFTLVASLGLLGLLTTFSRSAWLAFGVGLVCWLIREINLTRRTRSVIGELELRRPRVVWRRYAQIVLPAVLCAVFLVTFHELAASRFFHLETSVEERSITERQVDSDLALQLIRQHPWSGVGVQNYLVAVRAIEGDSRTVHNVLLLTAAELGLPAAALWLWLAIAGMVRVHSLAWAPWAAMLIAGLFDVVLYPTNNWCAAMLFGLLTALTSIPRHAIRGLDR